MTLRQIREDLHANYVNIFQQQTGLIFEYKVQSYPSELYSFSGDEIVALYDIMYCVDNKIDCNLILDYNSFCENNYYKYPQIPNFKDWFNNNLGHVCDKRYWSRNMYILRKMARKQLFK